MNWDHPIVSEHTLDQLLANGLYLVTCQRHDEDQPFSYMLMTGAVIAQNESYMSSGWRYFLLLTLPKSK